MEDGALGGLGDGGARLAACAPAVPLKSESFGSGFTNRKMAGKREKIVRDSEILCSSKITLVNFLSVPPLVKLHFTQQFITVFL